LRKQDGVTLFFEHLCVLYKAYFQRNLKPYESLTSDAETTSEAIPTSQGYKREEYRNCE